MLDPYAESTARLEKILQHLRMDPHSGKADELIAEVWKLLAERERLRQTTVAGSKGNT